MSVSSRPRKSKPPAFAAAALLLDLEQRGIRLSLAGDGMIRIRGPRTLGALDAQTRVQVNKPELLALLAGRDRLERLGMLDVWQVHLAEVAGNGARQPALRPDAGAEEASRLSDTWDDPPEAIPEVEPLAVDIETTAEVPPWTPGAALVSVGFSAQGKRWAYPAVFRGMIQRYLALSNRKIFHNCAFDLAWLVWEGFEITGELHDTLWEWALTGGVGSKSLKHLSPFRYAVHYPKETPDLARVLAYNGNDALATARVYRDAPSHVAAWRAHPIYGVYSRLALPLAHVSRTGIPLDQGRVAALHQRFTEDLLDIDIRLQTLTGTSGVNWGSPKQVQEAMGIVGSTCKEALRALGTPAALTLTDRRSIESNLHRLRKWRQMDRLRGYFKLNQAWTGRTASAEENLQNIPHALRGACGDVAHDWVKLDFASAELVVAAVVSECRLLLEWFAEGRDPHAEAAARIFHKPVAEVTKAERAAGKVANFNLLYGGGAGTIIAKAAERGVTLSREQAETIISEFFAAFPEIQAWQERTKATLEAGRPITSPLGRHWTIRAESWHELNEAMNAPIQSTASDLTLAGVDRAWHLIPGDVVNLVHDSLDALIPCGTFDESQWRAIGSAIASVDPRFPMRIEVAVGPSWGEAEERFTQGSGS